MPGNARKGEMKLSKYGQSNNSGSGEVDWERAGGGGGGWGSGMGDMHGKRKKVGV